MGRCQNNGSTDSSRTIKYLDTELPKITIPVQPEIMTTLVEEAALNWRLKSMASMLKLLLRESQN